MQVLFYFGHFYRTWSCIGRFAVRFRMVRAIINLFFPRLTLKTSQSLVKFLAEAHRGVHGFVMDEHGNPIEKASLKVKGRDVGFQTTKYGEFWRILLPGVYKLEVRNTHHGTKTILCVGNTITFKRTAQSYREHIENQTPFIMRRISQFYNYFGFKSNRSSECV